MPRTYGKAKQTRLSFAPTTLPAEGDDEMGRQATLKYGHPSRPTVQSTSSRATGASARKTSPDPFVTNKSTEDDNQTPSEEGSRKSRRKKDKKEKKVEKEKDENKVKDKKEKDDKKKDKKKKKEKMEKRKKSPDNPSPPPSQTPEVIPPAEESSDSDLEIQSSVRKPRAVKRKRSPSPEVSNPQSPDHADPSAQGDNDEDDVVARPLRKLRRGPAQPATIVLDNSSDESDEPIASSPVKRRRRNMSTEEPQTPRRNINQDQLDIEEDLEDLQDSVVKQSRTRGRVANSARAQRQKHLETLRRRRAGQTETDEDEEQSAAEPEPESSEDDSSEAEDDDEEEAVRQPRIPFAREDSDVESEIASNEDLDRYDKDFVLDDEDDKLGVPAGLEEMPIEFSRHAYKQMKDYFQDAVEWMVLNQLFPAFPRSSPIYKVAFDKLEDEVKGRTGSQLVSSVWNADFCRALMARPHLEETTFPTSEGHPCDACKRSGHPASSDLKFYGKAYSLETLEPLSDSDSDQEQSDNEDDGQERDRDGHVLPDENIRFYLGRHCKNRATMAHTLTHWRFHLNEWVVDHLERTGYVSDGKVLERSHWSQKRNAKYAGEAFRDMVDGGEVKKLWRDFHINLRTARESTTLG